VNLQWWCSAQTVPWSWTWRPYPGVWLFVLGVAGLFFWLTREADAGSPAGDAASAGEPRRSGRGWAIAALVVLWLALDWPIGALGGGYLSSVHMLQFLLIALLVPALFLLGVPDRAWRRQEPVAATPLFRLLTHPLVALGLFQVVIVWTHLPSVVDELMATQWGSFAIDLVWLLGGLLFWWPVIAPVPERSWFGEPLKMGYLFLATVLNTMPYAFLTFGETPYYGIYELAPPVGRLTAGEDQQIAGLLMKVGGGVILWTAITTLWFRWYNREEAACPTA
jgi:putative membrane protein